MYSSKTAALCCSIAACLLAAPSTAAAELPQLPLPEVPTTTVQPPTPILVPAPVARMAGALNRSRAARGLPPLRPAASLRRSATRYAAWMLRVGYFGHRSRIHASSRYRALGEALAVSYGARPSVGRTLRDWMQSPRHRALILSPRFRYFGVGVRTGRLQGRAAVMWVLHLGR